MFCDTPQVNQLTALLLAHKVRNVVVCPGSRNGIIVHNLREVSNETNLYPVTDERSAAFFALGITLATQQPAAVCVTSGSALLGCLPAVAEAAMRSLPLLVISADRPPEWIGQLDGQTLLQEGAFLPYCPTQQLCIPHTADDTWANNRCINEALLRLRHHGGNPAHINVPIAEPLFRFTTPSLPSERVVDEFVSNCENPLPTLLLEKIKAARLPALLIGQYERGDIRSEVATLNEQEQLLVLPEIISDVAGSERMNVFDTLQEKDTELIPDVIIQIGGNFVHKQFKTLLKKTDCHVIRIGFDNNLTDTFQHVEAIVRCTEFSALKQLCKALPHHHQGVETALRHYENRIASFHASHPSCRLLSFRSVLQQLRDELEKSSVACSLHFGNSTAIREAAKVFRSGNLPIYCNRGVNGIEGSLSTAVGYASAIWGLTIVTLGDLSFFYDNNAMWNISLPADLRILLLNDGHGGIFDTLQGLSDSPAKDIYIAGGGGHFSAEGLAKSYHLGYHEVHCFDDLNPTLKKWLQPNKKAQLLEVFL